MRERKHSGSMCLLRIHGTQRIWVRAPSRERCTAETHSDPMHLKLNMCLHADDTTCTLPPVRGAVGSTRTVCCSALPAAT